MNARQQFGEGERFSEVIVAAGLEPADSVVHRPPRAQNEDRGAHSATPQLLDERETVALREHQIDNRDVVGLAGRKRQPVVAVGRAIDRKAGLAQASHHEVGNRRIVLDEQRAHDEIIRVGRTCRGGRVWADV